jgi:bacterioferritin (cytochrome b1)
VEHLNEMLSAENAAVDRLDSRIQECLLPEGKQQLQHHQDETRIHQERLRQIITDLGGSPTDSKAGLPTLRLPTGMLAKKTLTDMAKSITGGGGGDTNPMPEELKLMHTKEDYGIEHVEIIAYRMLIQLCERSAPPVKKLLRLYDPPKYVDSNTMLGRNEPMSGGISVKA